MARNYRALFPTEGVQSTMDDPDTLTAIIETTTAAFSDDIEGFLTGHQPVGQAEPGR